MKLFRKKTNFFVMAWVLLLMFVFQHTQILFAAAPTVTTGSASSITKTTALLSGTIPGNGGVEITEAGFNYGTTVGYGSSVTATTTYVFNSKFGPAGSAEGQLDEAYGIAIDSSGNFYVADSGNNRIQKFDSSGAFVSMFGWGVDDGSAAFQTCVSGCQAGSTGTGDGQFDAPFGVTLDSSGNIYIADTNNNRIQKFNSSFVFQSKFGSSGNAENQFNTPIGLSLDSGGNLYVTDTNNNRLQKFDSSGVFVSMFGWGVDTGAGSFETCTSGCQAGSTGNGAGQFNQPAGIDIDSSGNIYIADLAKHRVQKFNSSVVYTGQLGTTAVPSSTNGQFNSPLGVYVDEYDNVFVTETTGARVQKFNSSGTWQEKFGTPGNTDGLFNAAFGVVVDSVGNVFVTDFNVPRVQKFSLSIDATQITGLTCGTTYHFQAYATNSDGTALGSDNTFTTSSCDVPDVETETATSVTQTTATLNGRYVNIPVGVGLLRGFEYGLTASYGTSLSEGGSEYVSQFGSAGAGAGQLDSPWGIALDSNGNIFVTETGNDRVQKFDSSGIYVPFSFTGGTAFDEPVDVEIDSTGNIYIADTGNGHVQKFNSSGTFLLSFGSGLFGADFSIGIDPSDVIYVADPNNGRVARFDATGTEIGDFAGFDFFGLTPHAIDFDSAGNAYIAETTTGNLYVYGSVGNYLADTNVALGFGNAFTVTVSQNNSIYVVFGGATGGGTVVKYEFDNGLFSFSQIYVFGGDNEFSYSVSAAVDSSENIYVTDTNNDQIQKLSLNFSRDISSLTCGTTYHYRAFATNSDGPGYGADGSFTTSNCTVVDPPDGGGSNYGCTDSAADNHDSNATIDDGSCEYVGCMDNDATNYDSNATVDEPGSCIYTPGAFPGCTDINANNHNPDANVDDGTCTYGESGCTDSTATNYDSNADIDDGSCEFEDGPITDGCMDTGALNFDPDADIDDGSCSYLIGIIPGCTDASAVNFDSGANENDGSCAYIDEPGTDTSVGINGGVSGIIKRIPTEIIFPVAIGGVVVSGLLLNFLQPGLIAGLFIRLWNLIPILMGYKRKKRPWGTVYDSVTKQPLDPVYVALNTLDGKESGSSITDLDGRYGFLTEAGTYTLSANKDNYIFPSTKLSGKSQDDLYNNLYFGGPVELTEKEGVIYKNIPMDAINFNWNEFAKAENKKLMKFYSKRDLFFARIANLLFVTGFVSSLVLFVLNNSILNSVVLGLYAVIFVLRFFGIKPKQSGYVYDTDGTPLSFAIIRLFSAELNREVSHTVVGKTGRYYMLTSNGEYYLKVSKKTGEDSYTDVLVTDKFKVRGGYVQEKIHI